MRPGVTSVALVGVAGQPVAATARLLAGAALAAGHDVTVSPSPPALPGGGGLEVHVRMGRRVESPCIGAGEAQLLVAFEQVEALRAARLLAPDGFAVVNERLVPTWRMRARLEEPPRDVAEILARGGARVVGVRAEAMVRRGLADPLIGVTLLGVIAALLPVPAEVLDAALATPAPEAAPRRRAFERGRRLFDALPERLRARERTAT